MLTIQDRGTLSRALSLPIDLRVKQLLIERRDQLGGDITDIARFILVQAGDSLKALEHELGFNILKDADGLIFPDPNFNGRWEWMADHGYCWESPFIFDDSGFANVIIIQNSPMQNRLLRALCLTFAE